MRRSALVVLALVVIFGGFFAVPRTLRYLDRQREIADREGVELPEVTSRPSSQASSASAQDATKQDAVNWPVPFTSQAPTANWDALHGEACEEASALMVLRYFQKKKIDGPADAEAAIQELVAFNESLGFAVDDTAAEVKILIEKKDPTLDVQLLEDPTEESMKKALNDGALIIVPAAGRELGNPYFQNPGPIYHMLVLRGYTKSGYVITNDPGTKRGEEFVYRWSRLIDAIHDWNGGDVENGAKVVLVIRG